MNTPKLISILSSPIGAADPSRFGKAADPAHGLDFSRLLGEKRSQPAAPAVTQRPSQNDAGRSRSADAQTRAATPVRQDNDRRETSSADTASAANGATQAAHDTRSDAGSSQAAAPGSQSNDQTDSGSQARQSSDTAQSAGPHENESPAQDIANPGATEEGAQLAQATAEAGLSALAASQAVQSILLPQEVATATPTLAATAQPASAGATATLPQAAATLSGLETELEIDIDSAAAQRLAHAQTAGRQQAGAPAAQVQAAVAQAFNGIDTAAAQPANAALAAAGSTLTAEALPANALPLPIATDTPSSAAALSLQEFTAMVAAARATSGGTLPPAAGHATPAAAPFAPTAMAGLAPVGMLPGQIPTAPTPGAGISAPLTSPQWPTELGRQFINIAQTGNGQGQVAELRLDPPELGPLRITINLNDNVAHAMFSSPHALVRQTVENALPQLQQMLEQAGISLGQANVNDQHQSGQTSQDQAPGGGLQAHVPATGEATGNPAGTDGSRQGRSADPNALVDTFA